MPEAIAQRNINEGNKKSLAVEENYGLRWTILKFIEKKRHLQINQSCSWACFSVLIVNIELDYDIIV